MDHILHAYSIGPDSRSLSEGAIAAALADPDPAWVHLRADDPAADAWIDAHLDYLPDPVRDALTAPATRPRMTRIGDGVLLILRGVNLNPGEDPEDMVSVRVYADASRVVTLSRRPLRTLEALRGDVDAGAGPEAVGDLVCRLIEGLTARFADAVAEMDAAADDYEERALRGDTDGLRPQVTDLRAAAVDFRRFLIPQRDAVAALSRVDLVLVTETDRARLVEAEDATRRLVEEVESVRERLVVVKDEIDSQHDERLNRNLYVLSLVSAIFLPLGFFTGLMGINIAGMPGVEWAPAFWTFTGGLLGLGVVLVGILWWLRFVRVKR